MTSNMSALEREELKRFSEAAERLVKRARQDKKVALELMRASGYFKVVPGAIDPGDTVSSPGSPDKV